MAAEAKWFLGSLFGMAVGPDALISIWTLPSKRTAFFATAEQAAEYACDQPSGTDVYFGVGLYRPGITQGRGRAEDVVAITSVWADIDYGSTHKKADAPWDEGAALAIIDRVGIKPSIVVHSGHGLHAYWMFTEPMHKEEQPEHLCRRWARTIGAHARCAGCAVDSVFDLARVLRVPGTTNHKGDPLPVRVLQSMDLRYDSTDIAEWCMVEALEQDTAAGVVHVDALVLDAQAQPPREKFKVLSQMDRWFGRTFNHNRPDLRNDTSAYDMSLAAKAIGAGWSDQETANLLIAFRREHKLEPAKSLRTGQGSTMGYVQRTIATAKKSRRRGLAIEKLEQVNELDCDSTQCADKNEVLALLSKALGFEIKNWIQHGREEATYSLVSADGTDVQIGSVRDVLSPTRFRSRVYEATGVLINRIQPAQWDSVCKRLSEVVEVVDNSESGRINRLREWLNTYLHRVKVYPEDQWKNAIGNMQPFVRDGEFFVYAGNFAKHLRLILDERLKTSELWPIFRAAAWTQENVSARSGSVCTCRSYWRDRGFCKANKIEFATHEYTNRKGARE